MRLAPDELALRVKPFFEAAGSWRDDLLDDRRAWFFAVLNLFRPRAKRLNEFVGARRFFFTDVLITTRPPRRSTCAHQEWMRSVGLVSVAFDALPTFEVVSTESVAGGSRTREV